jgi:hypothetical protein
MTNATLLVALMRDPELRAEIVSVLREAAPPAHPPEPASLLTASDLAKRLGVSVAHVRRLDPPAVIVGDATTKRFDLDAVRAWLADREPKPTTPAKREPTVDVAGSLARAGLRRAS